MGRCSRCNKAILFSHNHNIDTQTFSTLYIWIYLRHNMRTNQTGVVTRYCLHSEASYLESFSLLVFLSEDPLSLSAQKYRHSNLSLDLKCLLHFMSHIRCFTPLTAMGYPNSWSCPTTHHEGAWRKMKYSSYSFSSSEVNGVCSASRFGRTLVPGKGPPYPLDRRLGGSQSRSGHRG
jgi:hypothetical protein